MRDSCAWLGWDVKTGPSKAACELAARNLWRALLRHLRHSLALLALWMTGMDAAALKVADKIFCTCGCALLLLFVLTGGRLPLALQHVRVDHGL